MDHWKVAESDAEDVAAYLAAETGVEEIRIEINLPYVFGADPDALVFVGAVVHSDGRKGLSATAEEILEHLGWHLDRHRDIMTEVIARAHALSAHRRLEGVGRIQRLLQEAVSPGVCPATR